MLCAGSLGVPAGAHAGLQADVDQILARAEPPAGVVFEIVSRDAELLQTVIPAVRRHSARLRGRFPGLAIAVVSHGREQFALVTEGRAERERLHTQISAMSQREDIAVHVCGTHAGWRGVAAEDFPDYVDVAPSGPAQIAVYVELGYILLRARADD